MASLYHAPPSNHLQRVQNAAARLVLNLGLHDHVTPALKQLYSVHCMVTCRTQNQICLQVVYIYASNPHWTCITVYLVQSVQLIAESSRRPGLRSPTPLTTSNVALELNLVNVASVTHSRWSSCLEFLIPDSIMLATDISRFNKNLAIANRSRVSCAHNTSMTL